MNLAFWMVLCISAYVLTRIGLYELLNLRFFGTDFCLYDNSIWNAAQGTWLKCNMSNSYSYLGIHFSPILFLFVPFYKLGVESWFLILVRSAAAVGGAILLRTYAIKRVGLNQWIGSIFGISFLLNAYTQMAALSEFHGMELDLFFIPLFMLALKSKKKWFFWVSFILLLSVREDTWLYTTGIALLLLWKEDRTLAKWVCVISIVWGILALTVFMPFFHGGAKALGHKNAMLSLYLMRYKGYHLSQLFSLLQPRLLADFKLLYPMAFLSLLGGRYFILMLIPLFQIQLGKTALQERLLLHYSACVLPFAYIAAMYGWRRFVAFFPKNRERLIELGLGASIIILGVFSTSQSVVAKKKYPFIFESPLINLRVQTAYKILEGVPGNASISLQGNLYHIGSHRKEAYIFSGYPPKAAFPVCETEYVMVDMGSLFVQVKNYRKVVENLLSGEEYGVVIEKDGFVLLKKEYPPFKNKITLHHYRYRLQGENMPHTISHGEWDRRFDWKAARIAREGRDKAGTLAYGRYRELSPGRYRAEFTIYLKDGRKGWDALGLEVREKFLDGRKDTVFLHKTIRFTGKEEIKIVNLPFELKEKGLVEPIVFYGGHGAAGLDYVEFFKIKGNVYLNRCKSEKAEDEKLP